ncbi:MAG: hypothetical protein V2A34_05885, partial [Lentisphaerota bacterium]
MESKYNGKAQPRIEAASGSTSTVKFLLALLGHAGYFVTLAGAITASVLLLLPLMPFPSLRRRLSNTMLRHYLRFFALCYLPACRACRIVEVAGREECIPPGPVIFAANHHSSIDGILLLALLPPTSLIIKMRHTRKLAYACLVRFF